MSSAHNRSSNPAATEPADDDVELNQWTDTQTNITARIDVPPDVDSAGLFVVASSSLTLILLALTAHGAYSSLTSSHVPLSRMRLTYSML